MNIAEITIKNSLLSIISILLILVGGWIAYQDMPRFEDPEFIIREAVVVVQYPGASPTEVAKEVTEPLERAIQQMQEVEEIRSISSAGYTQIIVEIKYAFSPSKADLQQIWTKLRNKVSDARNSLPQEASAPIVNDDFGDVFGLYYFVTGDGYSMSELRRYSKELQGELLQADGVGKVSLDGEFREAIYVEISRQNAASLGVSVSNIYNTLSKQNAVVAAGDLNIGDKRLVIDPTGAIDSVSAIENLLISNDKEGRLVYLKDIANVWRGYQTPPQKIMRYNGKPAIAMGIANVLGANVVKMGESVEEKLNASLSRRPLGIEVNEYYHQGKIVETAVQDFVVNVFAALMIVIITLLIFMGFKSAIVIGAILLLTIAATLATMYFSNIPMHRISLGALIIALGMMVDNAIVVTEGILVGVQKGRKKLDMAKEIVTQTKWPLLGGTLVGIVAFAPIGFAPGSTAEFTGHLFWVILISLLFSWIFAITLTPLFCHWLFKEQTGAVVNKEDKESKFLSIYKSFMQFALNQRWLVVGLVVGMFVVSAWGFQFIKDGFFPASTTPQIVVDYSLPMGTDISKTEKDILQLESFVTTLDGVNAIETSIGAGGLRFMLVYSPESNNSSYGQLLVRVDDYNLIEDLIPQIQDHITTKFPEARSKVWRFALGPGGGSKIEAMFKGADPKVLRELANKAKAIMAADGRALSIQDDWSEAVAVIEPQYSAVKGSRAGISREDLAGALQSNFSGKTVGVYRENEDLIPIISRAPANERVGVKDIENIQVLSSITGKTVPIRQVVDGFRTNWRDGQLRRVDRVWTIKAQSDPFPGDLASDLLNRIRADVEAIELPDGYSLEWDGEYGDSKGANEDLASTIPIGLLVMVLIVIALFRSIRQPVVIFLVVPLSIIGVVSGLLIADKPLEFMALLGVLSLSGLLIKNAIVLVDQMNLEIAEGKPRFTAIIDSAASRVRPVMMGTLTTVLGVIPLLSDAFFQAMAVVIIGGLSFATILTLVMVPVLYAVFFRVNSGEVA